MTPGCRLREKQPGTNPYLFSHLYYTTFESVLQYFFINLRKKLLLLEETERLGMGTEKTRTILRKSDGTCGAIREYFIKNTLFELTSALFLIIMEENRIDFLVDLFGNLLKFKLFCIFSQGFQLQGFQTSLMIK